MLIVSKKLLILTRILMWGGLALAAVGTVFFYVSTEAFLNLSIALLAGGIVVSLLSSFCMRRLFRCPNCKKNVLGNQSSIDLRNSNCPDRCPHCGADVRLED